MKRRILLAGIAAMLSLSANATHVVGAYVIDKDYIMVQLRDGEIRYRDDATGPSAYLGDSFAEGDDTLVTFLPRLNALAAADAAGWTVTSAQDPSYKGSLQPTAVFRKSKPMHTDHRLLSELDHWLFLRLPASMKQGATYNVTLPGDAGADKEQLSVTFDIWNVPSEAVHVNINGYAVGEQEKKADLYLWLGDGGPRDYASFEGKKVYLYNTVTGLKAETTVRFWKPQEASAQEAGKKDLTGSPVWDLSFTCDEPGTYRLVVEDVGCSMDFTVSDAAYFQPYRYSVLGYYYMRIGEPIVPGVNPPARQPRFAPGEDPAGFKVYLSDLQPWHPDWRKNFGDVWDEPHYKAREESSFWQHRPEGNPVNDKVAGGHSDAYDWDRHLAHVSNIYDMVLPYILTGGKLNEDDLGIRESGNGIPDLLDEARNEVDFFLSIRDGEGYSQGVTNPDKDWTVMFQAGCTTIAAWANAANCATLAEAFRLSGHDELCRYYTAEAVKAYRYAEKQEWNQLDDVQGVGAEMMRGRDFKQQAAAYLYNLTGDRCWEDAYAAEVETPVIKQQGWFRGSCQTWALAAYITCPHERHYEALYRQQLASLQEEVDRRHLMPSLERPSRRGTADARWQTSENLELAMMDHYVSTDPVRRARLLQMMYDEAGWCLGRNPGNIIEMTGLGQRHITDAYSCGRNDGFPGTHPGQTPFNGTETWSKGDGGDATILLNRCYPSWKDGGWPRQESYFNQRYLWVNGEFTPRETMRGKLALTAYLYGISL